MAIAATKLLTADKFFDWVHRPENRDRRFELEEGEIVELPLSGERHGAVCANVTGILGNYTFAQKKGYVCSNDMGLILKRDPDTVRGPDVTLYTQSRQYHELQVKFAEKLPTLVVEMLSPNDTVSKTLKRVTLFQKNRIPLVWLVDPLPRSVTIFRLGQQPEVFAGTDEISGMDVLPDFKCAVRDLFVLPGE